MVSTSKAQSKENSNVEEDNGEVFPSSGKTPLTRSVKNITNAMLKPQQRMIFSTKFVPLIFSNWKSSRPGRIVRKVNPKTCRKMGTSRSTHKLVIKTIETAKTPRRFRSTLRYANKRLNMPPPLARD
jgi:hypothetical protein